MASQEHIRTGSMGTKTSETWEALELPLAAHNCHNCKHGAAGGTMEWIDCPKVVECIDTKGVGPEHWAFKLWEWDGIKQR